MREHLPAEVCWRRDKKGFITPEVIWLQEGVPGLGALFDGNQTLSVPYLKVAQIKQRLLQLLAQEPWVGHSHVWRLVNLGLVAPIHGRADRVEIRTEYVVCDLCGSDQ